MLSAQFFLDFNTNIIKSLFPVFCNIGLVSWLILTLSLLKVIKVNVLPSNFTHRYEVRKGKHGFLYFAQTIADAAISSHNITHIFYMNGLENLHLNLKIERVKLQKRRGISYQY